MCEIIRLKTEAVPEIEFVLKLDPDGEWNTLPVKS
jgi:hypothetical protein